MSCPGPGLGWGWGGIGGTLSWLWLGLWMGVPCPGPVQGPGTGWDRGYPFLVLVGLGWERQGRSRVGVPCPGPGWRGDGAYPCPLPPGKDLGLETSEQGTPSPMWTDKQTENPHHTSYASSRNKNHQKSITSSASTHIPWVVVRCGC